MVCSDLKGLEVDDDVGENDVMVRIMVVAMMQCVVARTVEVIDEYSGGGG